MQCKQFSATAHYVTDVLDDGPIIEQGMERISPRDALEDFAATGCDMEEVFCSRRAVHIENRILLYKNKAMIFE